VDQRVEKLQLEQRPEAISKVEKELGIIFGGAGKDVVIREVAERYGVPLSDAIERPERFRSALSHLTGEFCSHMVMGRINKRVWGTSMHGPSAEGPQFPDFGISK
jgi:hypothetical protein